MTHGPDAVHELIVESQLAYPVSVRDLEDRHGVANVQLDETGQSTTLVELLGDVDATRYEDEADLHAKLEPVFERQRARHSPGPLERLKRLIRGF